MRLAPAHQRAREAGVLGVLDDLLLPLLHLRSVTVPRLGTRSAQGENQKDNSDNNKGNDDDDGGGVETSAAGQKCG